MSAGSRIAAVAVAGFAAAVALAAPAAATTYTPTAYIYTFPTLSDCTSAGAQAVSGGVFTSGGYVCQSGFTGYDLIGEPTGATFSGTYIATFPTLAQCQAAGNNGKNASPKAWKSFTCRSGVAGWDLLVSS
ncbi:hypothetical protein [Actinokineospora globicatena]|uniref:hypothetical protein n=1 Tax=Actinokineospora globicatena TaxID=103729 RepID=UPI0020A24A0E|nr:hypothetical protein [Actinokineospora globicatena]MCP2306020.1 hypothetical protein [Actinokineospora globicatena]GLW80108.1 hypothetical protein Aglo01_45890 [Actinokineospora globicatena]GLW86937.1 hypothetical protein Aglo02_45760 [Actinokineospora globicatena]